MSLSRFRSLLVTYSAVAVFASLALGAWKPDAELLRRATDRWETDIQKLEALDRAERHPDDAILFIGSSSIRRWDTIAEDMVPYHAIQRGYGGARFSDAAVFAERLIRPHKFRAMVVFVANDVTGGEHDATPEEVVTWFKHICSVALEHQPQAEIFCIEITPTRARWNVWPKTSEVNAALAAACAADPKLHFIPTASAYLNADSEPREKLFVEDKLHLNHDGYQIWAGIISSHLDSVLRIGTAKAE